MLKLYGVHPSPFVRKVRFALAEKGLAYEHDPIAPFGQPPEYFKLSPLGKIPALVHDGKALCDSSIIVTYLDRIHPETPLLPADPYEHARALWFEEYGDSVLAQNLTGTVFFQRVVRPRFFNQPGDEAVVSAAIEKQLPPIFAYLEGEIGGTFAVGSKLSIGDLGLVTHFVNARLAGYRPDASRWPKLTSYVQRIIDRPAIRKIVDEEGKMFGVEV